MKKIINKENITINSNFQIIKTRIKKKIKNYLYKLFFIFTFIFISNLIIFRIFKNYSLLNMNSKITKGYNKSPSVKTNIINDDEFLHLSEVRKQIKNRHLNHIETISGGSGNVGNALIILNNLINVCEKIGCKNIISPGGLHNIIKRPIIYRDFNITIFPNSYKNETKIDIELSSNGIYYFSYKKRKYVTRLYIIRDEVLNNIPKYLSNPNDLYINIRSGDIFINKINTNYAQPPLCFYQKIIKEFSFRNIYLLTNGHENPIVDELIKIYPKIKFLHGSVEDDISVLVYAYNLVMAISTFPLTVIHLNDNLKKLFIYDIVYFFLKKGNYTIYIMKPSQKYIQMMKGKWRNTKEQLNLMLNENCIADKMTSFIYNDYFRNRKSFVSFL